MSTERSVVVHYEPGHELPTFDEAGTPMLTFVYGPPHGWGWELSYLERDGNGVEDHFVPGGLSDVDEAVESARRWLDGLDDRPSSGPHVPPACAREQSPRENRR